MHSQHEQFRPADVIEFAAEEVQTADRCGAVIRELNQQILLALVSLAQVNPQEAAHRFGIRDESLLSILAGLSPNDIISIAPSTSLFASLEIDLDMLRDIEDRAINPTNALRMSMLHMKRMLLGQDGDPKTLKRELNKSRSRWNGASAKRT